jgi:hypothetical protein
MSAKRVAGLFSDIFRELALNPDARNRELALWLWGQTMGYDFEPAQLQCDDALIALDLASLKPADTNGCRDVAYRDVEAGS